MKPKPFIPRWLNEAGLSQADFRVNCCIHSRADKDTGIAFPQAETIARDCCMAKNTVWKSLRSLEEKGFIRRLGKPFKGSNRYQILTPPIGANEMPVESPIGANGIPIATPPIGANEILQSAQMDSRQSAQTDSREGNPRKVIQGMFLREKSEIEMPFDSENFRQAWSDWQQHRKEIKKPLTPTSSKQQLRNFADWGEARAIAAIRYTIGNGWQGIREPDPVRNSSTLSRTADIPLDLGGRKPSGIRGIPTAPATDDSSLPDFGQLETDIADTVRLYPKREKVSEAIQALAAHVRGGTDLDAVAAGTRAIAAIIQRMPGGHLNTFVPSAAKFFQNRRWEDDPKTWLRGGAGKNGAPIQDLHLGGRRGTTIELPIPPNL